MERPVKERMIGAGILVLAGVVLIPWLLDGDSNHLTTTEQELILPGSNTQKNETRTISLEVPTPNSSNSDPAPAQRLDLREVKEIPTAAPAPAEATTSEPKIVIAENKPAQLSKNEPASAPRPVEPPQSDPVIEPEKPETTSVEAPPPATFTDKINPSTEAAPPVEVVSNVPKNEAPPPQPIEVAKAWAVQVGAFASQENAERLADRLRSKSYAAFVMRNVVDGRVRFRVRVGPVAERAQAELLAVALREDRQPAKVLSHP